MQRMFAAGTGRAHRTALQADRRTGRQTHMQTNAQAERRTGRQMRQQTARRRSLSVKWWTARRQLQKEKWNKKHDHAWYIGKDSTLKMNKNLADEAAAVHMQKQCA